MSIGHRLEAEELSDTSVYELYSQLGAGDTAKLFEQRYAIDAEHDCPLGAGNSTDRRRVLIDRILYQEIMDNAFKASGLTPEQLIGRFCDHEHSEICLSHGDNGVDTYYPCHNRALKKEHLGVLVIHCPKSEAEARKILEGYETALWPGLVRCYHRPITKPAKDYWCGPLLDDPSERDEEILETLRCLGVVDAGKYSKLSVRYGHGAKRCKDCTGWFPEYVNQERGAIAACHRISGLVRCDRWCQMWIQRKTTTGA